MRIYDNRVGIMSEPEVLRGNITEVEHNKLDFISGHFIAITLDTGYRIIITKPELDRIIQACNNTDEA